MSTRKFEIYYYGDYCLIRTPKLESFSVHKLTDIPDVYEKGTRELFVPFEKEPFLVLQSPEDIRMIYPEYFL